MNESIISFNYDQPSTPNNQSPSNLSKSITYQFQKNIQNLIEFYEKSKKYNDTQNLIFNNNSYKLIRQIYNMVDKERELAILSITKKHVKMEYALEDLAKRFRVVCIFRGWGKLL